MKVCVITDNAYLYRQFRIIANEVCLNDDFVYYYSYSNTSFNQQIGGDILPINLEEKEMAFFDNWDLFISLHCKQIFPEILIKTKRCINIHPGFNPFNRGWYPHIFSIYNGKPAGVTIHEIDEKLDHGRVIYQEEVAVEAYDTAETLYRKIQDLELRMIKEKLPDIVNGNYEAFVISEEGNINYRKDFRTLCELHLDDIGTLRDHINLLRALTYTGYNNAFFIEDGKKIFVCIKLTLE